MRASTRWSWSSAEFGGRGPGACRPRRTRRIMPPAPTRRAARRGSPTLRGRPPPTIGQGHATHIPPLRRCPRAPARGRAVGLSRLRRRRHVDLRQPAARSAQGEVRVHADARMARARTALERELRRRLGSVRLAGRARADEPPRGPRAALQDVHGAARLHARRVLRAHARRGDEVPRPRAQGAVVDGERDRLGERRDGPESAGPGAQRAAPGGARAARAAVHEGNRAQDRIGRALPGRRVLAVPLPHLQ